MITIYQRLHITGIIKIFTKCLVPNCILVFFALNCNAQWLTQEIKLGSNKNAVYLTVQPEPNEWDEILANESRITKIWLWNKRFSTIQFSVSPDIPLAQTTDWQVWVPKSDPEAFLRNLSTAIGNMAYIFEVKPDTPAFTLRLKGRPIAPKNEWLKDSLNLMGFHINPNTPPTFHNFFSHSDEISDVIRKFEDIAYEFKEGDIDNVTSMLLNQIEIGKAYWIRSKKISEYTGPIAVLDSSDKTVDFGIALTEKEIHLKNVSESDSITVTITQIPSEFPPHNLGVAETNADDLFIETFETPELAGSVPLSYYDPTVVDNVVVGWVEFNGFISQKLEPGEEWKLRIAVRRVDFEAYIPESPNGASYQSILKVEDSLGINRFYFPVSATTTELSN